MTPTTAPPPPRGLLRALLLLAVTGAVAAGGTTVLVAGPQALGPQGPVAVAQREVAESPAAQAVSEAQPGTCLTWTTPDASDITQTRCTEPHLFEVAATADVTDQVRGSTPSAVELAAIRTTTCVPAVQGYLDGRFDPEGRFTVGLINPGAAAWEAGNRTVRCGVQSVGRSGTLFPTTGTVANADQSDVVAIGTCLGIDGTRQSDPVDCAQAHASEAVAVVDLADHFAGSYPPPSDQDAYLETVCDQAAAAYTGGGGTDMLTVFWDDLAQVSWNAGSHKVNCSVGHQLDGGGFAPVTGDARSTVSVGTSAAPTATSAVPGPVASTQAPSGTPQDGAPANAVPTTGAPSTGAPSTGASITGASSTTG